MERQEVLLLKMWQYQSNHFSDGWSVTNYSDNGIWVNKIRLVKVLKETIINSQIIIFLSYLFFLSMIQPPLI